MKANVVKGRFGFKKEFGTGTEENVVCARVPCGKGIF